MESNPTIKKNIGMTYGLVAGLIIIVIVLIQYIGGLKMYMNPILGSISYLILITIAVLAALKLRKQQEGFLEFGEALKVTFTVFALALFMQTVFTYILFNFIDISFKDTLIVESMNKNEQWLRKIGTPDDQIEKAMDMQRGRDPFSVNLVLLGYGTTCIIAFIFCLLISLVVRKKKPAFNNI